MVTHEGQLLYVPSCKWITFPLPDSRKRQWNYVNKLFVTNNLWLQNRSVQNNYIDQCYTLKWRRWTNMQICCILYYKRNFYVCLCNSPWTFFSVIIYIFFFVSVLKIFLRECCLSCVLSTNIEQWNKLNTYCRIIHKLCCF